MSLTESIIEHDALPRKLSGPSGELRVPAAAGKLAEKIG